MPEAGVELDPVSMYDPTVAGRGRDTKETAELRPKLPCRLRSKTLLRVRLCASSNGQAPRITLLLNNSHLTCKNLTNGKYRSMAVRNL